MRDGRRMVPPTGFQERGSMDRPTIEDGLELPGEFAGVYAPNIDLSRKSSWQTVWEKDVHHFVAGRLYVACASLPMPAGVITLAAEVRIYSSITGFRDLVKTGSVNSFTGPLIFDLEGYKTGFVSLSVDARQMVDGLSSGIAVPKLSLSIGGRLFR